MSLLVVDTATGDTKIPDSAIVVGIDDTTNVPVVLVTTETASKRRKRSGVHDGKLHEYGGNLPPGCKYGMQ